MVAPIVRHGIAWFRDAPAAAFERAHQERKPVVVDLWAPWCHTCLSMQEYVLTAEKLPGMSDRFVFLAIDTERAENAELLNQLTLSAWPTFYVLSADGSVRGRWVGGAAPGQFARFLADGLRAEELARLPASSAQDPLVELVAADELAAAGRFAEAAEKYGAVLVRAKSDWPRRSDALVARAMALKKAKLAPACVELAFGERPDAAHPVSSADFAATLLDCADQLPRDDPRVRKTRRAVTELLEPLCTTGHAELTPDDRGDACGTLIQAREVLADGAGARRAAVTRLSVLEAAATGVPDEIALMYDFARSETLVKLGRGREALDLLSARERALPQNYNPPHYLARVHRALKEWNAGLLAIDRALLLAYGPRKAGLYGIKAELLLGSGRKDDAVRVLTEQLALYRSLPDGQRRPDAEAKVLAELARLERSQDRSGGRQRSSD